MTIQDLEARFCVSPITQIIAALKDTHYRHTLSLTGLAGSSYPLLAAKLIPYVPHNQLFILQSRESAVFFYADLEQLLNDRDTDLPNKRVHYFPSSYRRAHTVDEIDNAQVKLRSEIINKLTKNPDGQYLIVTYPEAIAEKVVSKQYINQHSFVIAQGNTISVDVLLQYLYDFEYKQEEFVFEPGQFAWRGGIFDIFSFSEEYPCRIELDGDKIESIRFFNPETQLSIREEPEINIMPHISSLNIKETRTSFFDFLHEDDILWTGNPLDIGAQIRKTLQDASREYDELPDTKDWHVDEFFIRQQDFDDARARHHCLEINARSADKYDLDLHFDISPQNNFGKSFDLLLLEWIDHIERGVINVFLSESQSQLDRIYKIMLDLLDRYNRQNVASWKIEQLYEPLRYTLHAGFSDPDNKLAVYTDHEFFGKYQRVIIRNRYKKSESFTLREIYDLQPGDYVVHIDYGIGIYQGLQKLTVNGKEQDVAKLAYKDGDALYVSVHALHRISKYVGKEGTAPTLHRLGSGAWEREKERTKKRIKKMAINLVNLYSQRKARKGFAFSPDNYMQQELEASFIYEDTPDQIKTLADVKADMESDHPMERLICGDVGFGKTEIAIRAAFKAVCDSKQVAVLVPTTILALQHYTTFSERLANMPCNVEYVNRFKSGKEIKNILQKLKEGQIDILIGTHRLLSKDVSFKDLGLLIIDEEQKFGVAAKEKLRELRVSVDTLTMSATPIPRTLQFSLMGARDISVISTPPPNRYPIQTEVHVFDEDILRDAILYEMKRNGQVFVVHNKIQDIEELAGLVQRLVPTARIAVGHGQMEGDKLEKIMTDFINGQYDVLVSTTIVESGLDIINANTMIIDDAQNFSLNVLHQLRGRVGRNNVKAFCHLFIRSFETLNDNARKRLQAIENYSDIGSGIQIALRDLDIRGAGNIFGADQSGFINEIGFDMYRKILNEAIQEMKDTDYVDFEMADNSGILQRECLLETDIEALLPTDYVSSTNERMSLYKELGNIHDEKKVPEFRKKLEDVFGPLPKPTEELLQSVPLRLLAAKLYFEKIVLKKGMFNGFFFGNPNADFYQSDTFSLLLNFMQLNHPQVQLKETNHKLIFSIRHIPTIKSAMHWLQKIARYCNIIPNDSNA